MARVFLSYRHEDEPQYFIKSDKTNHIAIHKGATLRLLKAVARKRAKKPAKQRGRKR